MDRPGRSRRKKHPASSWLLRLAILPLGFALLALATPTVWGQLAPQPDAPPGQGEANFPPLSQPAQAQPQTQPAAPTQPQLNSQPPSTPAQPRATPSQSEQGASPEQPKQPAIHSFTRCHHPSRQRQPGGPVFCRPRQVRQAGTEPDPGGLQCI